MNPNTNQFESLPMDVKPPSDFIEFRIGEVVSIHNYDFKIIRISPNRLHLEPVGRTNLVVAANAKNRDSVPDRQEA